MTCINGKMYCVCTFSSVQLLSHVRLFGTPWTTERQASTSVTNCWSLLKLMSIELVMPSNHLILCRTISGCHKKTDPFLGKTLSASVLAKSFQSRPTLCDPMNCSLPGSSVHGILQGRVLSGLPCPPPGSLSCSSGWTPTTL